VRGLGDAVDAGNHQAGDPVLGLGDRVELQPQVLREEAEVIVRRADDGHERWPAMDLRADCGEHAHSPPSSHIPADVSWKGNSSALA